LEVAEEVVDGLGVAVAAALVDLVAAALVVAVPGVDGKLIK
jgi:hypothetical protein